MAAQDCPNARRGEPNAHGGQLPVDPPISPCRVLSCQTKDERDRAGRNRRSSRPPVRVGPVPSHEFSVPSQQSLRLDEEPPGEQSRAPAPDSPGFCNVFGQTHPFSALQIVSLYSSYDNFALHWQNSCAQCPVAWGSCAPRCATAFRHCPGRVMHRKLLIACRHPSRAHLPAWRVHVGSAVPIRGGDDGRRAARRRRYGSTRSRGVRSG